MEHIEPQLKKYVQKMMATDPAHDLSHIERVVLSAKQFAHQENAKLEVIIPAAWLHDCVSLPKDHPQRYCASRLAAEEAIRFLRSVDYPEQYYAEIEHAIEAHSYSANIPVKTLEAAIVQDADRIDALGAIGIARCIQVGTSFKASLYSDEDPFCETRVYNDKLFTIDHFYTKLFKLQDTMNTAAARQEAVKRTEYMKSFLTQLRHEIKG
ncbi:HD domain-containing protein [Photobacterium lipolyticum]|uniref:Phosphohydrolase n=1 Tax=Photobacterium lipolyticum TaxID=266810 RepID=A0A2T3MYV1_9GAMM|nr:HD domain-containing protein [Photobacterium lipolyticum]PSW05131.1 phosphohydrolase [Photobacterium lipolyticum]